MPNDKRFAKCRNGHRWEVTQTFERSTKNIGGGTVQQTAPIVEPERCPVCDNRWKDVE